LFSLAIVAEESIEEWERAANVVLPNSSLASLAQSLIDHDKSDE